MTLDELNALDTASAERELLRCCGSRRWAREVAGSRPFADRQELGRAADDVWRGLDPADWLEAFAAHPRIGDSPEPEGTGTAGRSNEAGRSGRAGEWSVREQAGMDGASEDLRRRLALVNRVYEDRFGFIYIVCATGKTGDEMLAIAERRVTRSRDEELLTAAEEQRRITRIRLETLIP
jgi:OHCU decarboxylase